MASALTGSVRSICLPSPPFSDSMERCAREHSERALVIRPILPGHLFHIIGCRALRAIAIMCPPVEQARSVIVIGR
jgi:hypothetical protein|eukprot:COSAG02_NODE_3626_length_6453_cov_3.864810_8_plen_76_part_00